MFYFVALELDLYVILFRFFSGPILFCFHKGIITERYPLWVPRNIGTGMEPNLTKWREFTLEAGSSRLRSVSFYLFMTSSYYFMKPT